MDDLRSLAETYVALTGQIEEVRRAMLACLSNGIDPNPIRPARVSGGSQPANARATEEAKAAIVQLLKDQPGLGTSAIAQALGARVDTTTGRLKTLRTRGAIVGGGREGWRATAVA
jgi:hypothetical protein